jgi:hypothetical protein
MRQDRDLRPGSHFVIQVRRSRASGSCPVSILRADEEVRVAHSLHKSPVCGEQTVRVQKICAHPRQFHTIHTPILLFPACRHGRRLHNAQSVNSNTDNNSIERNYVHVKPNAYKITFKGKIFCLKG